MSENLKKNSDPKKKIEISPLERSIIEVVLSESPMSKITQQKEKSPSKSSFFNFSEEQSLMASKITWKRVLLISQEMPKSKHIKFD